MEKQGKMKVDIKIDGPAAIGKTHLARCLQAFFAEQTLPPGTEVVCTTSNDPTGRSGTVEFGFVRR